MRDIITIQTPMTKPAQNLLRDLLEYASHSANSQTMWDFSLKLSAWDKLQDNPESAFRELELLANPVDREEMTDEQHSEYSEARNLKNREPLRD